VLTLAALPAGAQQESVACAGQRIDEIIVIPAAPTVAVTRHVPIAAAFVRAVHTTTHADLIRRFLLLRVGDRCDELRRAESERILRTQPFIAEASVRVLADSAGGVALEVRTSDEIALVLGAAAHAGSPPLRFLRVGDANLSGEGVYVAADWRHGGAFRDGFGVRVIDNQFLGKRYTLLADAHRTPLGSEWETGTIHPFVTDLQRAAWVARVGANDEYVQFRNDEQSSHAVRLVRNFFDVGGIARIGRPGHLALLGASLSGDDERPGSAPLLITPNGFAPDTSTALAGRYTNHRIARANLLLGLRDLGFKRVQGFDALTATQDMPVGLQIGALVGRGLPLLGAGEHDLFVASDVYAGTAGRRNALRVQVTSEGRRSGDTRAWDGILTSGRAVEYWKLSAAQTTTATLEFSGGWRQRIPFKLSFGDPDGGLRGFSSSNVPGGRRLVFRLDHRVFIARPNDLGDLGAGAFVDAGRLWAGDIPYGVTTPVRASAGVSLLAAVPPRSPRLWRLDLAYVMTPEPGRRRLELRLSSVDRTRFFLTEPSDIGQTREQTVPASIFRWPE
jgi:hypothetical protein